MSGSKVNGKVPEASASTSTSATKATRRLGRSEVNGAGESAVGSAKSRSLPVSQPHKQQVEFTPEILETERANLLEEKQAALERVVDKHDDLVRELFHMQQFTMMVLYDPLEAKSDNSEVFQKFKSDFDLLANAVPTSRSMRQTRQSLNERRQMLGSISAAPSSCSSQAPAKSKGKSKTRNMGEMRDFIANFKSPTKHGKAKEEAIFDDDNVPLSGKDSVDLSEPSNTRSPLTADVVLVRRRPARSGSSEVQFAPPCPLSPLKLPGESVSPRSRKRRRDESPVEDSLTLPTQESTLHSSGVEENLSSFVRDESISTQPMKWDGRLRDPLRKMAPEMKLRSAGSHRTATITPSSPPRQQSSGPLLSKSKIKRIKLIVRRPPPQLSNPNQRPPRPNFNSSLSNFLSSYISIEEGRNVLASVLQRKALEEAKLRSKVARLRREGRFGPQEENNDDTPMQSPDDSDYVTPERTSKDHWDVLLEEVVARYQAKPRRSIAMQVTSAIASRMQAHFDSLEAKKLKAKEIEEKKLRNLAKSTIRMVIAEWKKAVFHIREKQRLEEEEEERRLGRAHLDAILSQSGQILETQHEDLSKGDVYRSQSPPDSDEDEQGSETDLEDETDRGNEENEEAGESESVGDMEEAEGEGSYMLLDDNLSSNIPTRSETPVTSIPDDDGTEVMSTSQLLGGLASIGPADDDDDDDDVQSRASSEANLNHLSHPEPESSPVRLPRASIIKADVASDPPETSQQLNDLDAINQEPHLLEVESSSSPTVLPADDPTSRKGSVEAPLQDEVEQRSEVAIEQEDIVGDVDSVSLGQDDGDRHTTNEEDAKDVEDPMADERDQTSGASEALEDKTTQEVEIPQHLKPYAVAQVFWDTDQKVTPPLLLRGVLRPYQQSGLEWLASLHTNKLNGILADEMGLGKTIQTIALLAHLACDIGIWGPHLIVVPTSVLLNWEMEFKKFLPGFRILSYHGSTKRRKELRQGWNEKHHFNVCITSYALASRDAHIFKRKAWYYLVLDEAHMIKNFKSQRWNILLMFRSYRRLLLTGTPLQNNLTELWALLQFLMSGANFANLKEFGDWFSNPLEKAIEMGNVHDDETLQRVSKLHTVLRPYLLRRLKRDVEKELPSKFEHLTLCPLSKRQRFLYDEFMSRAQTRNALQSGVYQKIANILMQLRKVCNHPDLFEVRPIVTSFAMSRSAIADFEVKEFLVRRRLFNDDTQTVNLDSLNLRFIDQQNVPLLQAMETRRLDATAHLPFSIEPVPELPARDTRTVDGFHNYTTSFKRAESIARWAHVGYLNRLRCNRLPIYSEECISTVSKMSTCIIPFQNLDTRFNYFEAVHRVSRTVKSYSTRAQEMAEVINAFAFTTHPVIALDLPHFALPGQAGVIRRQPLNFDEPLHHAAVKLQIAFPEPSLLQYDCGKLQKLAILLREKKAGGHRVLIFTQMTRILDVLETFLNFHGYLYLRLDGATKIEDRQYITERFNADPRLFCFISSSRSGGVGINLTGADTVIFYDSDFNPQMDKQCEDRAHRIGQIRDVHIYRFVSQHTVEEAMLRKANQKRSLDDLVIQKGEFDWRTLFSEESTSALSKAIGEYEDAEDRLAAAAAAREETSLVGADEADFDEVDGSGPADRGIPPDMGLDDNEGEEEQEGGTVVDYMVAYVQREWDYFSEWRL